MRRWLARCRLRWTELRLVTRAAASLGVVLVLIAAVMLPGSLREQERAALLGERGVATTADDVRVRVEKLWIVSHELTGVEVTFRTQAGDTVTADLAGVVSYSVYGPAGWRAPDADTGYTEPLRLRYDAADPTLVMAEDDWRDYRDYSFAVWDVALLVVGLALTAPAAYGVLRPRATVRT